MDISFLHPAAGWLGLFLLPFVWFQRRQLPWAHLTLRTTLFACLVLALMQPSLIHRSGSRHYVFVVDQRDTIDPKARTEALKILDSRLRALKRQSRITVIQLGGGAHIPSRGDYRRLDQMQSSSMSAVLSRAIDALPIDAGGTITLISDGLSSDQHWDRTVEAIKTRHIVVNTIELATAGRPAFISDIQTSPVRVGETVEVKVGIDGAGTNEQVALYGDGRLLSESPSFQSDGPADVPLTFMAPHAGFMDLHAVLSGPGISTRTMESVVAIQDPIHVLYIGGASDRDRMALQHLIGPGFMLDSHPASALTGRFDYSPYQLVVFNDVPLNSLPAATQEGIAQAVQAQGLGLFYTGGASAFGGGENQASPLARALPIIMKPLERVEEPSVALVVVIDTSGSMDGRALDMAKQTARLAIQKLKPTDYAGVVEFYGGRQWAMPIQPVRNVADFDRAIGRMQAQGTTMLLPALEEAYYALKDVNTKYKHILVISDAGVEEERYDQLIRQIADDRMNLSTVLVGDDPAGEALMSRWARLGRGRYYTASDPFSLVQLDFKPPEIKPQPNYKPGNVQLGQIQDPSWWAEFSGNTLPPLSGYTQVTTRAEAQTLVATTTGDPVLGTWQFGAGRATAFMTQPTGNGTEAWRNWSSYGDWLSAALSRTANQQSPANLRIERRFDRLSVLVQFPAARSGLLPSLRFQLPNGAKVPAAALLEQRAPGLYVLDQPFAANQPARVEVQFGGLTMRAADPAYSDVRALALSPKSRALPLQRLATLTGGTFRGIGQGIGQDIGASDVKPGWVATALWPWLSLLALLIYLGELVYRRWPRQSDRALQI